MLIRIVAFISFMAAFAFTTPASPTTAADVAVMNNRPDAYEVAVALTSPGFRTEGDGIIRRHQEGIFRIASNISGTRPWDLVIWKRANGETDWRFSTAYRIPSADLAHPQSTAILSIDPSSDRVYQVAANIGPGGTLPIRAIQPWMQGDENGSNSESVRPNSPIRLGVNAYRCDEGIHIQAVTLGSAATRSVDQASRQPVQLESGDHILTVNGMTPRNISEFQSLIQNSPRTIQLKVLNRRTRRIRNLTTNLW